MSEQKDNLHYQHQYAEDLDEENMSEIDRLEEARENMERAILAFKNQINGYNEKIAELKKAEEPKKIGMSMTEQQGMIVVSVSEDGKQRSQYIYEDWTQVFRQLPNEEEFKHE